jgi:CubicO group peptidase (beta-lactamase class C family)
MTSRLNRFAPAILLLLAAAAAPGGAAAQEPAPLVAGQRYEGTLQPGGTRTHAVALEADRFVSGRIHRLQGSATITITGPDDEHVERFDANTGPAGAQHFRFRTTAAGTHRIQVTAPGDGDVVRYLLLLQRVEPVATTPEGRTDQTMAMFGDDTPGAVIAVVRNGQLVFARGYGMANLSHDVPFTVGTVSNIGSTAKQFTAFALALLESRGRLSLDEDVRTYLPELPDFGPTVTLRHLLTHTSGYREFLNTLALAGLRFGQGDHISQDDVINVVRRQPRLQNEPGAEWNYNNSAYVFAAMVVERVTDRPFPEWMAEEVFAPLRMDSTFVRAHPGVVIPDAAMGYVPAPTGFREARDIAGAMGAGSIYTTVADLARWMRNLHTGELGGPDVIRQMTTPFVLTTGDTTEYGLGLFIDTERGLNRIQHGGGDTAHQSTFIYYPELQAGYVVLSNHAAIPGAVGPAVGDAFFGEAMAAAEHAAAPDPAAEAFDPEMLGDDVLDAYAGRYALEAMAAFVIRIFREDRRLRLQATGQPAYDLIATSDSTFTIRDANAAVTFHRDEDGVNRMTLHQGGNHLARRVEDAAVPELAGYPGRYFSEELETYYTLELEEGHLVVRHRRFGPVRLTHQRDDTFSGGFPLASVVFERDAAGRVTGLHAGNVRTRDVWFEKHD